MTFLAPTILAGLIAAAIPIIIHLISLLNTREVSFSTLRFIKELEHETIRRLKIRQWLLLLLRTLAIVCLVMMFARPVQHGFVPGWMAGELESRVVIFVDNSASMALETSAGALLENSRKIVPQIVNSFEEHSLVEVYQTNPIKQVFRGYPGETSLRPTLETIQQTVSRDRLWFVIDSVLNTLEVSEPNRECFILSDFQSLPDLKAFALYAPGDSSQPQWRFYCLGQEKVEDNLSIRDVKVVSQIRLPNHLLKLNARIVNDGNVIKKDHPLELYLNADRVGQVVSTFYPDRTKEFLFQAYPGKSGVIRGMLELPGDDFDLDNHRTFELPIPERIVCTIIGPSKEEIYLTELAISSIDNQSEFLTQESRSDPDLERLFLDDSDVLILYNPGEISDKAVEAIQSFLIRGGGVIWFAGDRQAGQSNKRAETALQLPRTSEMVLMQGESYFSVNPVTQNHPILADLEVRNLERELPQVFGYVKVIPRDNQTVILRLNNGQPFLLECPSNGSRIFYFTSLMDLKWNDLPMRGLAVPLLHRILLLLATDETNTRPILVDEQKLVNLDQESINSQWTLVTPSGKMVLLIPDFNTETLKINQTSELGSYDVLSDGYPYTSFSTLLAPQEYPSVRMEKAAILNLLPKDQTRWIEPNKDLTTELKEIRHGKSLWRIFLIMAIILMLMESILGRTKPEATKRSERTR